MLLGYLLLTGRIWFKKYKFVFKYDIISWHWNEKDGDFLKENKGMFINAMHWARVPAAMLHAVVLEYHGFSVRIVDSLTEGQ